MYIRNLHAESIYNVNSPAFLAVVYQDVIWFGVDAKGRYVSIFQSLTGSVVYVIVIKGRAVFA